LLSDLAPRVKLALTMDEVAHALGCSRRSVYRLLARGEIEAVKVGSLTRIPVTVLEYYVAKQLAGPPSLGVEPARAPVQWRGRRGRRGPER
jgi:excisionase family DNA binding protein